jgi:hypothetical protein
MVFFGQPGKSVETTKDAVLQHKYPAESQALHSKNSQKETEMTKMIKGVFDWIVTGRTLQVAAMMKNRTYWI